MLSVFLPSFLRSSSVCAVADTAKKRAAAEAASLMEFSLGMAAGNAMLHPQGAPVNPSLVRSYDAQTVPACQNSASHRDGLEGGPHVVVARRIDGHRPAGHPERGSAQGARAARRRAL